MTFSPIARCSWLRSSTAPSESTPASISGASASTAPPAVCLTVASTASSEIMLDAFSAAADGREHEATAMATLLKRAGTVAPPT